MSVLGGMELELAKSIFCIVLKKVCLLTPVVEYIILVLTQSVIRVVSSCCECLSYLVQALTFINSRLYHPSQRLFFCENFLPDRSKKLTAPVLTSTIAVSTLVFNVTLSFVLVTVQTNLGSLS